MSVKLKRVHAGLYKTPDGKIDVWHSTAFQKGFEDRWYVNHKDYDETLQLGGFPTKRAAVQFLNEWLEENKSE